MRSRPYRKNDAPYVESKNWSLVRQYTGWRRYDTEEEYRILRKLMKLVSIRHNLIVPQMKVVEKHRIYGKKIKRYEIDIPLNRVLRVEGESEEVKRKFVSLRDNIKIVKLTQAIIELQRELDRAYNKKKGSNGNRTTIENSSSRPNFEEVRHPRLSKRCEKFKR